MPDIFNVFPLTIYVDKVSNHEIYKEEFYKIYSKYDYSEDTGANTVSEGYVDPLIHLEPSLNPLFNEIANHVRTYIHDVLKFKDIFNVTFTKTWLSRMNDFKEIPLHIHSTSHISFAYYLNTPLNSHKLTFHNPHCSNSLFKTSTSDKGDVEKNMVEEYNLLNSNTFFIYPKEGYLALFPSSVLHGTESIVSNLNGDRLAIIGDITLILKEEYLRYTNGYVDQKYWRQF